MGEVPTTLLCRSVEKSVDVLPSKAAKSRRLWHSPPSPFSGTEVYFQVL